MSKRKHKGIKTVLVLAVLAGTGVYGGSKGYTLFLEQQAEKGAPVYKTETVRKGNVSSGIREDGTISYGTQEQTFQVAEITQVSLTASSDSDASTGSAGAGNTSAGDGSAMPTMGTGMPGGNMGAMSQGGADFGNTKSSTGSTTSSDSDSPSLVVEEVCLAPGQVAAVGDKVLVITKDSIEEYRAQLEAAVATAELKVLKEEINLESKKADADYTYNMYLAEGAIAEETYQATLTSLDKKVQGLKDDLAEAEEEVSTYQEKVDNGYDYEEELEEAKSNYATIEANLQIAQNNRITGELEAKQTRDTALTNYKYADQLHEIDTNGLEDDWNDAKDVLQETKDALEDFDQQIGDGNVYAEYSGTVTEVAYAAGDSITNDAVMITYTDPEKVTMEVSVSQEDVAGISVGAGVEITLNAYPGETFAGTVSSIATSSTAGSSTVNYAVTVQLTGDTGKVYSGMDGQCTFGGKNVTGTLYVSNKAVRMDGIQCYVMVMDSDGNPVRVDITTGYSNGTIVAVESGLEEGQEVMIESQVNG